MPEYKVTIVVEGEDRASGPLRDAQGALGGLGGAASSLAGGALGLATAGLVGLGAAGAAFVHEGLSFNNTLEMVTAQLNAFTKDGEKSAEILEMIKARAARTPFAFEEMAKATASLLPAAKQSGQGLEDLVGIAEILAASNPAEGLEGAAFALKEAMGGDFVSIVERFNLPRKRLQELKEQGVPAMEAVRIAMSEMGLDADLVSNMANTASGRWSTFKDTITNLAGSLTQPIFALFSSGLGEVQTHLDAATPMLTALATELGGNLAAGIQVAIQWGQQLAGQFQGLVTAAGPVVADLSGALPDALAVAGDAFNQVQALIAAVMPALLAVVTEVLGQLMVFWKANGAEIMAFVRETWTTVSQIIKLALDLITAIVVPALRGLARFWRDHGTEIQALLRGVFDVIRGIVSGALALITGILKAATAAMRGDWTGAWNAMKEGVSGALAGVKTAITGALEGITGALGGLVEGLAAKAGEIGRGIIDGIRRGIEGGIEAIKRAAREAAQAALDAALDLLGIKSPSKVFEAKVGANIAAGMAKGMEGGASVVERGAGRLADAALAGGGGAGGLTVGGAVRVELAMRGDLSRWMEARIEERLRVHTTRAGARLVTG